MREEKNFKFLTPFRSNGGSFVVCIVLLYIQELRRRLCCQSCTPLYSGVTGEVVLSALYSSIFRSYGGGCVVCVVLLYIQELQRRL